MDEANRPPRPPDGACACGAAIPPIWIGVADRAWHRPRLCTRCLDEYDRELRRAERAEILLAAARFEPKHRHMSLDNYRPRTELQAAALASLRGYEPGADCNLVIWGPVGVGKSHLAVGTARALIAGRLAAVVYHDIVGLLNEIKAGFDDYAEARAKAVLDRLYRAPVLLIDDLGRENMVERNAGWIREQLYLIVNSRGNAGRPTWITTNLAPDEIRVRYEEPISSRLFEDALVLEVDGEDYRLTKPKEAR